MRIGVVGAGTIGTRYAEAVAAGRFGEGLELVGVADLDGERAARAAEDCGTAAFESIDALIEHGRPEALYIATPDDAHRGPAVRAAEARVPFLLEKPLATSIEDAEAIARAVAESGVVAEVNFSNRWNPPFVAARQSVERGELGEFVTLFTRLNNALGSPTRRLAWAGRTTPAWFLLSHCLDLGFWLHGRRAVSVYASGVRRVLPASGIDTYDSVHAIVRYEDGSDGTFESVWVLPDGMPSPVEFTFRYVGDRGAVTVDTHEQNVRLHTEDRTSFPGTLVWAPQRFGDFVQAARGERAPGVPIDDGVENTRILVALHRSLESGRVEAIRRE